MSCQTESSWGNSTEFFKKRWPQIFSKTRRPLEGSFLQEKQEGIQEGAIQPLNAYTDNIILLFMQDSEDSIPSPRVDEVVKFCQGAQFCHIDRHFFEPNPAAWLDDSCETPEETEGAGSPLIPRPTQLRQAAEPKGPRISRPHGRSLTASMFYKHLKPKRFGHESMPDADRRLIFISGMHPYYILALAKTTQRHQVPAVRDALRKYLTLQTSLRVTIPLDGYTVFQLEFHMSYYALRTSSPKLSPTTPIKCKPDRGWTDLSFLTNDTTAPLEGSPVGIREAQVSLVICGSDEKRWVAYCFVDTGFDDEEEDGEDIHRADRIADGNVDANRPIWNPREYFLLIVRIRMEQILKEWTDLVRYVETQFKEYNDAHPFISEPSKSGRDENEVIMEKFQWTNRTLGVARKLLESLSKMNTVWKRFSGPDGDIAYFIDPNSTTAKSRERMHLSHQDIRRKFEELEDLERVLHFLVEQCQNAKDSAQFLQTRLTHESNQAAQRSGSATEIMILVVSPVAATSAFFSIPATALSFPRNSWFFILCLLIMIGALWLLLLLSRGDFSSYACLSILKEPAKKAREGSTRVCTLATGVCNKKVFKRKPRRIDTSETLVQIEVEEIEMEEGV